jgi:glycosyltransferase involved in cell wall biosynthesis
VRITFLPTVPVTESSASVSRDQSIYNALRACGHDVVPLAPPASVARGWQRVWCRSVGALGWNCSPERSAVVLRARAAVIERQLAGTRADLLFSLSSFNTSFLRTSLPMVTWTDAVFACIVDFYPSHTRLDPLSLRDGHRAEQRSLRRCAASVLTSHWAASCAARHYRFPIERLHVVPRGLSLPDVPSTVEVARPQTRGSRSLQCLIVGNDWHRKGASAAWQAVRQLRDTGAHVSLVTVGMQPPASFGDQDGLQCVEKLDKRNAAEWARFRRILLDSDVLLLPSKADFTPNVIIEAYAFGIPVIATAIGGIPEMVEHSRTGYLVEAGGGAATIARCLTKLYQNRTLLAEMREEARAKFQREMTPELSARRLTSVFEYVVESRRRFSV